MIIVALNFIKIGFELNQLEHVQKMIDITRKTLLTGKIIAEYLAHPDYRELGFVESELYLLEARICEESDPLKARELIKRAKTSLVHRAIISRGAYIKAEVALMANRFTLAR